MQKHDLPVADVDRLLSRIMRGTTKLERSSEDWIIPNRSFAYRGPGNADESVLYGLGRVLLEFDRSAREVLDVLARRLHHHLNLQESADAHLVEVEIAEVVGEVLTGVRRKKGLGDHLIQALADRFARSVTVFPVGGLNLSGVDGVVALGDRILMGPLNDATEAAFALFSEELVGVALRLTDDAWWTEDLLAYRSDPEAFDDGPPRADVTLVAVCVDSIAFGATLRAKEQVEALLGALWLVDQRMEAFACSPPWILGGLSRAEAPSDPDLDRDDGLPLVGLQVSSRTRQTEAMPFLAKQPNVDVAEALTSHKHLIDQVARAESPDGHQALARRLAAACRLGWMAGQDDSPDVELLHLVVALESLVSDHAAGAGVTTRFVARLLTLSPDLRRDPVKLAAVYDMRSEVGHQGFSAGSRSRLAKAAAYALDLLTACVVVFADTIARHDFRDESEFLAWLDQASPDVSDPFA